MKRAEECGVWRQAGSRCEERRKELVHPDCVGMLRHANIPFIPGMLHVIYLVDDGG
jgi:hypothetical protein